MVYFYEDKQFIIAALYQALQYTRAGLDIEQIRYEQLNNGTELAIIIYYGGTHKPVDITADSGIAVMSDILRAIGRCS